MENITPACGVSYCAKRKENQSSAHGRILGAKSRIFSISAFLFCIEKKVLRPQFVCKRHNGLEKQIQQLDFDLHVQVFCSHAELAAFVRQLCDREKVCVQLQPTAGGQIHQWEFSKANCTWLFP